MGGGSWSPYEYRTRTSAKRAAGLDDFDYSDSTLRGARSSWKVHESLDPKGLNSLGANIRESRDSDEHPESLAIAVLFDVTGSMHGIPRVLQQKLPQLLGVLQRGGYVANPQILFGAIGDATSDAIPLQVGQFESDNRMDVTLESIVLEGGGGGGNHESYQLAAYYLTRHSSTDCWEKRGHKGYVFLIGDERVYTSVDREEVRKLIGDDLQEDISTEEIFRELQQRYEVFFLFAAQGSYQPENTLTAPRERNAMGWRMLLGQNALILEDAEAVCETIASILGTQEGGYDLAEVERDLIAAGADRAAVNAASKAVSTYVSSSSVASASGPAFPGMDADSGATRI